MSVEFLNNNLKMIQTSKGNIKNPFVNSKVFIKIVTFIEALEA